MTAARKYAGENLPGKNVALVEPHDSGLNASSSNRPHRSHPVIGTSSLPDREWLIHP